MHVDPTIFRAYDIRGTYPDQVHKEVAYRVGRAYASFIKSSSAKEEPFVIVVQHDARASSSELKEELVRGLLDEGMHVVEGGLATTPLHYFSVNHLKADGGVMVTASHNPSQYNGFKLSRADTMPIGAGLGMEEVRNIAVRGVFELPRARGTVMKKDFLNEYIVFLMEQVSPSSIKDLTVVFDLGNGMTGLIIPHLLRKLPIRARVLFQDIDMLFPNHEANPMKEETLHDLKAVMKEEGADLGVAFDGDGDRVAFLTHEGKKVSGDIITAFLARHYLAREPGAKIVYDLRASRAVPEDIRAHGGTPVEERVGRAFLETRMREENAPFGGEVTGHYYFRDFSFVESGMLAMLLLLELVSESGKTLKELVEPLQARYHASGEINFTVADTDEAIDALAAAFAHAEKIYYRDGLSIVFRDFWFNVRHSNTEPLLRLNLEAVSQNVLAEKLKEVEGIITALVHKKKPPQRVLRRSRLL